MFYEILTKDQLNEIHLATLEILQSVGLKVQNERALKALADAGADVDFSNGMAKIPERLVKEAVKKAPSSFRLYGRNPKNVLRLDGKRVHFATQGTGVYVLDLDTGRRRYATVRDTALLTRLADGLDNIDHVSEMVTPKDVPETAAHAYSLVERLRNTEKPTDGYNFGESAAMDNIRIASRVLGGEEELRKRPILLGFYNPFSPLTHSVDTLEGLRVFGKYGQPVIVAPEAQAGMTAPATLAGVLSQTNAEILSGIVIAQIFNPGAPVLYGNVSAVSDMKTGNIALGGPETGLINVGTAQLARYYGIPSRGTGGVTDSNILGVQSALEQTMTLLLAALGGINFIYDAAGSIESTKTASYEQLVISNDMCGMAKRILRGIDVSDEKLAVDIIRQVGPGGMFISHRHTLEHFKKEHFIPSLMNRNTREVWEKKGSRDITAISKDIAKSVLAEHQPKPLDPDVEKDLVGMIQEIEKRSR
jgi:trimethylamine--corrinoid protein Co-methyltransferase